MADYINKKIDTRNEEKNLIDIPIDNSNLINAPTEPYKLNGKGGPATKGYVYLTNPVYDSEGNLVEPAKYLDAEETFEEKVFRVWNTLSESQKFELYLEMERQAKLNQQAETKSGIRR